MAEVLTLTTAETVPSITTWSVSKLVLDVEAGVIEARLRSNTGKYFAYREQDADTLPTIIALNKANLTIKSLQRRVLERISAKGAKSGTVSGTAD